MGKNLKDTFRNTRWIAYPLKGRRVNQTVAEAIAQQLAPNAEVIPVQVPPQLPTNGTLTVSIADEGFFRFSRQLLVSSPTKMWSRFRLNQDGSGSLVASHPHFLYPLFCKIKDDWLDQNTSEFARGKSLKPTFFWLRNFADFPNDCFVGSCRKARHFDREDFVRQLARQGFSHLPINGLGVDRAFESGPPGDVYSWFYDYSPDLDQFVDSKLIRGYYPPRYLKANLRFLKENAKLAIKYGLIPGLHINSPRSMPEEFWRRYGFLRGARVDHPRESFRPRYTLTLTHPVVQSHYRELIHKIMREIPEIGFIHLWSNDSGAGFEFVTSLYAGRNGGPYLIREWKREDEIARKAAENALNYFYLIHDEAKKVNPGFRFILDLSSFHAEKKYIIPGLRDGMDIGSFGAAEAALDQKEKSLFQNTGALHHIKLDLTNNNVLGVPYPWLVYERLSRAVSEGKRWVLANTSPRSLAPYDINGEVLRAFQFDVKISIDKTIRRIADRWVGSRYVGALMDIWKLSDSAVRHYPSGIPYSTFAFPWFRLWVRPFVPNIDAIPEKDRAYYEKFLIATFNNPTRIDLNNDMLWNFLTVKEAGQKKNTIDRSVLPPLRNAVRKTSKLLPLLESKSKARDVFYDLHLRMRAVLCYCGTMRNVVAWIESVHGYLKSKSAAEKRKYRCAARDMVLNELGNARALLALWEESAIEFMPVSTTGETPHIYGENFGALLKKKIDLMEKHIDDEPSIDPNYMWRIPGSTTSA